jgi:VanZ family protein
MPSRADPPALWRALFALALIGVLVLALIPASPGPDWFEHADKLRHAAAFIALWAVGRQARLRPGWTLALGLLGFGIGIELLQALTPTRESSLGDVLADAVGIAAGRWLLGAGL